MFILFGRFFCKATHKLKGGTNGHKHTGRHRRTYNAGNIRTHGVHKQEVLGIFLLANLIGNAGGHGNGRNTGRTDKRIDLSAGENIHKLSEQHSESGSHSKGEKTESHYL